MFIRAVIILNALIFVFVIPYLEISATHLYSPDWPGHARLHEAWQLICNAVLALFAVSLAWQKRYLTISLTISFVLCSSFVAAFLLQNSYGGTMKHSDGSELLIAGINPAFGLLLLLSAAILMLLIWQKFRMKSTHGHL